MGIIIFCMAGTGVSDFDAGLFRVSGAEAVAMDSQQRLLLEISHEVVCAANPPGSKAKVRSPRSLRLQECAILASALCL